MKKMNVCHFFFFMQYLPLSWLGRVTRWQLLNFRTTRHIDCHKNKRNAGKCRHNLRESSVVTDIMQFHISVYQLRSPRIEDNRTDFTSIEFNIYQSRFTVWRKRHISRLLHMPVQNAVSLNGSKNTICFTWSALEMSSFASWLYERGIF